MAEIKLDQDKVKYYEEARNLMQAEHKRRLENGLDVETGMSYRFLVGFIAKLQKNRPIVVIGRPETIVRALPSGAFNSKNSRILVLNDGEDYCGDEIPSGNVFSDIDTLVKQHGVKLFGCSIVAICANPIKRVDATALLKLQPKDIVSLTSTIGVGSPIFNATLEHCEPIVENYSIESPYFIGRRICTLSCVRTTPEAFEFIRGETRKVEDALRAEKARETQERRNTKFDEMVRQVMEEREREEQEADSCEILHSETKIPIRVVADALYATRSEGTMKVVSPGCGTLYYEEEILNILGEQCDIQIFGVDPAPESYQTQVQVGENPLKVYPTIADVVEQNGDMTGETLLVIWSDPGLSYDVGSIDSLQPRTIVYMVAENVSGSRGFHEVISMCEPIVEKITFQPRMRHTMFGSFPYTVGCVRTTPEALEHARSLVENQLVC